MKRLLAVLTVCAVMTGVFASCGDDKKEESESKKDVSVSESSDEEATEETEPTTEEETEPETEEETEPETEEETEPETEEETESETEEETESETEEETESETIDLSDATIEGSIDGLWMADNDLYGFSFESGGTGGILADATEKMHFTADGGLAISTVTVEPESVNYDGTTLSVEVEGNDMLTMIRNGESAPDSYDGEYTLISGALYDGMAASMAQSFGISESDAEVYVIVDGEEMFIEFAGLFTYTAENGELEIQGNFESLGIPNGSIIEYKFSDDKLVLINGEDDNMIFTKIEF